MINKVDLGRPSLLIMDGVFATMVNKKTKKKEKQKIKKKQKNIKISKTRKQAKQQTKKEGKQTHAKNKNH